MWYDNRNTWATYDVPIWISDHLLKFPGGHRIRYGDMKGYFDDDFWRCVALVNTANSFPNQPLFWGRGILEVPKHILDVLQLFDRVLQRELESRSRRPEKRG